MVDRKLSLEEEIQQGEEKLANKPKWDFSTDGGMKLLDRLLEGGKEERSRRVKPSYVF